MAALRGAQMLAYLNDMSRIFRSERVTVLLKIHAIFANIISLRGEAILVAVATTLALSPS